MIAPGFPRRAWELDLGQSEEEHRLTQMNTDFCRFICVYP